MTSRFHPVARRLAVFGQARLAITRPECSFCGSPAFQSIRHMPARNVLSCGERLSGVPSAVNLMGRFVSSVPAEEAPGAAKDAPLSLYDRLKGVFRRKAKPDDAEESFSMNNFLNQLRQAQRMGNLASFGRGLPKGGEKLVVQSLKQQEAIVLAMSDEERAEPNLMTAEGKARVANACGCSVVDVDVVLQKYDWMKRANVKMMALKEEGKPIPKTMEEVEALMGEKWVPSRRPSDGSSPSRNGPCPCGSGKRYKRCCGAGT